jgi:hypothetical protein
VTEQPTGSSTVEAARAWLRAEAMGNGARCPCCRQFSKVYRRNITSAMARALIVLYREGGIEWQDKIATLHRAGIDAHGTMDPKLRYWGLLEEDETRRDDGVRSGRWRVTRDGALFAQNLMSVQKYALVYDGRCLGRDGPPVTIRDCLGDKFDYYELMGRRADTPEELTDDSPS